MSDDSLDVLRLWQAWRGRPVLGAIAGLGGASTFEAGRSAGLLPFRGALADQPACLIEAFAICDAADAACRQGET